MYHTGAITAKARFCEQGVAPFMTQGPAQGLWWQLAPRKPVALAAGSLPQQLWQRQALSLPRFVAKATKLFLVRLSTKIKPSLAVYAAEKSNAHRFEIE